MNRVTQRSYTGETGYATPSVFYFYDNLPNAKGKLIKVLNSISATENTSFDILGRVLAHRQMTDGQTYTTSYNYALSGALVEQTYPSGRVVKNTLDADGDLAKVESKKNASDYFRNYATSFVYTSAGALSSLRLGNGKFENTVYNSRLQPVQIGLGSSATTQNLLKLNFDYGAADNNGNVKSQTITVPTVGNTQGFTALQTYSYDSLNRIKQAAETINNNQNWKQSFTYDRYGNRRFDEPNTTTLLQNCPTAVCNPQVDAATNKLVGYTFDSSGNTKVDPQNRTFIYDGENKQVEVKDADGNSIGKYFYDGDGRRVKKLSLTETTMFVYDATGQLVSEHSTKLSDQPQIAYLTADHLGSPRINTNAAGQVISRHDYQPFGEEIARTNYGMDEVRKKFTGYERDSETNLDFAEARMFGNNLGRFTTPDPLQASASSIRPQSWNRYSYSYNNPLRFTDPSGMVAGDFYNASGKKIGTDGIDDKKIHIVLDTDEASEIEKTKGAYTGKVDSKFTLPNAEVVTAIGDAVERSNNATYDKSDLPALKNDVKTSETATGGFREAGVSWKTTDGKTEIKAAPDGDFSDPRVKNAKATIMLPSDSDGDAHIHPSGEIISEPKSSTSGGGTSIGGAPPTTASFVQPPSSVDIANAGGRNRIVVGAGNKTVYFYNSNGTMKQTMKLSNFLKIGRK